MEVNDRMVYVQHLKWVKCSEVEVRQKMYFKGEHALCKNLC